MKQGVAQLAAQGIAIWKQLGLNQRISVVLATGAVLAGLLALALFASRTSYGLLFGRLDDAEAARVIAALDEAKVPYEVRGAGSIYVPVAQVHVMKMQLAGKGIGRRSTDGVGMEIFDKPSFGLSDKMLKIQEQRAREGELARTIGELDSVESARVHLATPDSGLLLDPTKKHKASVTVAVRGNTTLSPSEVNAIRFVVANGVDGLSPSNVSVTDTGGHVYDTSEEEGSTAGLATSKLRILRDLEHYLARKAEEMLNAFLGPRQAMVRVSADIDWNSETVYKEEFDPDGQVMKSQETTDEEMKTTNAASSGAPGVASNLPAEGTNAVTSTSTTPVTSNSTKKKVTTNQYEVNRTVSSLLKDAGSLRRLSAAVMVAPRYEGEGAARKIVPRGTNELQQLGRLVERAIGLQIGTVQRNDEIEIAEMPVNDQPMVELTQQLDRQQTRQYWTELGFKLVYPVLGLGVLFLFWRAFRGTRTEDVTLGLPLSEFAFPGAGNGNGNGNGQGRPHRGEPKVVTVEVLNQLIRENPGNMTHAVRSWLTRGKAAK